MADANASTPPARRNGSRYLFMALLGLVIGAVATVSLMRVVQGMKDPYPEAVMTVLDRHIDGLKASVVQNRCGVTDALPHLQAMRAVANDIEPAFKDAAGDEKFVKYASDLRGVLDGAIANPPSSCAALQASAAKIGEACGACHRVYKD